MNRPPRDDIDPMVPELSTAPYEDDERVIVERAGEDGLEVDAPFVPHVSY